MTKTVNLVVVFLIGKILVSSSKLRSMNVKKKGGGDEWGRGKSKKKKKQNKREQKQTRTQVREGEKKRKKKKNKRNKIRI